MKNLNKRRLTTFMFFLKKRLLGCVSKAGKKEYKNNIVAYNNNNNQHVEASGLANPRGVREIEDELQHVEATGLENPNGASEIEIEDEEATCRICLECEVDEDDHLISPCMCKGSVQFVHRSCLDRWRSDRAGFDFSHCTTCKARFHLRVLNKTSWRTTKFTLFVTRDIFLVFLCLQTVIGMMGGLAYLADTHRSLFNHNWFHLLPRHPISFYYCVGVLAFFVLLYVLGFCYVDVNVLWTVIQERRRCCYWLPESIYICFSVLIATGVTLSLAGIWYGKFIATRAIEGIWRRHSHILVIDYTQIYEVEDLKGCYTRAKLDPEEMERLKTLKLL